MKDIYLNTLRDSLTGHSYQDGKSASIFLRYLAKFFGFRIEFPMTHKERDCGLVWPAHALTMVGTKRLDNLRYCIESVISDSVEGDIVECGVWRGGASIYAAGVLMANNSDRHVWLCDSFDGLPLPESAKELRDIDQWMHGDVLSVPAFEVCMNFARHHLDSDRIHFIQGWFKDTLKDLAVKIAVLRADGDMYASTKDILEGLYHKVTMGGYIIIDDYLVMESCHRAVDEFRREHGIYRPIQQIDQSGVFWRKQ